jgi:hypothetical protein
MEMRQVGGYLRFSPPIKTDHHNITEILLKVVLNTITNSLYIHIGISPGGGLILPH